MLYLPHHVSPVRPHMDISQRAAQFSPFAALTGYGAVIQEAARRTDQAPELTESEKAKLDYRLNQILIRHQDQPELTVTYFQPDPRKSGGAYLTCSGRLKSLDMAARCLIMADHTRIPMDWVTDIESPDL